MVHNQTPKSLNRSQQLQTESIQARPCSPLAGAHWMESMKESTRRQMIFVISAALLGARVAVLYI